MKVKELYREGFRKKEDYTGFLWFPGMDIREQQREGFSKKKHYTG